MFFVVISLCILFGSMGRISMKKALEGMPPLVCALIFEITQVVVALPFLLFYEAPTTIWYSLISGTLFAFSLFFYFLSFHQSEVSLLTPLRGLRGVIALFFSFVWWGELLTPGEILGILVIGIGVLVLQRASQFKKLVHFLFHREAIFMLISVVLGVVSSHYDKLGVEANGLYTHYLWTCGFALVALLIAALLQYRQRLWEMLSTNAAPHNIWVGVIFAAAYVTHLMALQLERVTIVNALLCLGTLVTTLMAGKYLKEQIREKIPGTVLMVIGTMMIALL